MSGPDEKQFRVLRDRMVQTQILGRGIRDPKILKAMSRVPRHLFVPPEMQPCAYDDNPLPIGEGQTISQPYIVALMTQLLDIAPSDKVLEIGTGSGYQAAVLASLAKEVITLELLEPLAAAAGERLKSLGYANVRVVHANGVFGWSAGAPYDKILVAAAAPEAPKHLTTQLKTGGKLIAPVGHYFQELVLLTKTATGVEKRPSIAVRFVPLLGGE